MLPFVIFFLNSVLDNRGNKGNCAVGGGGWGRGGEGKGNFVINGARSFVTCPFYHREC